MYQAYSQLDLLVAERHELHERHLLIRHCDETGFDHRLVGAAPVAPRQLLVLASPHAHRVPSLVADLPALLRSTPDFTPEIESVWLGVGSLAADTDVAQRLAEEIDVEIVVPDGGVAAMPGAALYAGHSAGGTGWHQFRPDRPAEFYGARFPRPEWESWVPATPVELGEVVAVPAPCGLLVHDRQVAAAEFGDAAFGVPVNQRFPKLVVYGTEPVPSPAAVAALLGTLPTQPIMVVPATPEAASHIWQVELALHLSRDVVFSAGLQVGSLTGASTFVPDAEGNRIFRPFPVVLRQPARGGDQQVLDVAAAPPGWVRDGRRSYRLADGSSEVVADVVPSGLVLRPADGELADLVAEVAPFDPEGWTLALGTPGQVVGLPVLTAAENLLAALPPEQRAVVRVRMAGIMDEEAEHALDRWVVGRKREPALPPPPPLAPAAGPAGASESDRPLAAGPVTPPPVPPVRAPGPSGPPEPDRSSTSGSTPVAAPPASMPPIMTTSAAPVSTVSGPPAPPPVSGPPAPPPTRQPDRAKPDRSEADHAADPGLGEPGESHDTVPAEPERPPAAPGSGYVGATPPPVERTSPMHPAGPAARPLVVPVRASTAAEQTRFATAAGDSFGEALATVNAALATWPSMRADESPGAKADYVAVCLYLGRGDGGAHAINGALRIGQGGVLDGQVPCLMSGIRRLPTHRRAVLRQGKVNESLERRSTPGTVLTEPGFLAASMDLDVTTPGADLDVLIWPNSARRTAELMLGRPINEAVFVAGARFKALAVRTATEDDQDGQEDDDGAPAAPKVAVLFRELAPGEAPDTIELDERDLAVLAKLDNVLARRQQGPLRLVEDPEAIARLTTSMVVWQDEAADAGRTAAVAS